MTNLIEIFAELACERSNRAKAEKNRSLLSRDLEDLGTRYEEYSPFPLTMPRYYILISR